MPRTGRLLLDGGIYHVLARGNNGQRIFHAIEDYRTYLNLLVKQKHDQRLKLYHFVLMPNHVHLIVEAAEGASLSKAMLKINLGYSLYYRRRRQYQGHLWQGRFKSLLIDREQYLLACGRYVERNPVRAGLAPTPAAYPWSSYAVYASGSSTSLVDLNPLYAAFGTSQAQRQQQYRRFVEEELHGDYADSFLHDQFIGSAAFIQQMRSRFGLSTRRPRGRPRKIAAPAVMTAEKSETSRISGG